MNRNYFQNFVTVTYIFLAVVMGYLPNYDNVKKKIKLLN